MSTTTADTGYETWIQSIKRHTGIVLSDKTCRLIEGSENVWRDSDPKLGFHERLDIITQTFSLIDDFDLHAMETCSHQNTPFGHAVRVVIFERLLFSQK